MQSRKSPAECPASAPQENNGVWVLAPDLRRPSPYRIQWREDGVKKSEAFTSEKDRDKRVAQLRRQRRSGKTLPELSRADVLNWMAFKTAIGETPWQDVVAAWRKADPIPDTPPVVNAVEDYLKAVKPEVSDSTYRARRPTLRLFAGKFGVQRLHEITAADITRWLDSRGGEPVSYNTWRKTIGLFFKHYKLDPVAEVPVRNETLEEVTKLTVDQTRDLFAYAKANKPDLLGRLACEAFAGLRFSSAFRLEKADIRVEEKGILLPAAKTKDNRRHYIDGLPDNLWTWLRVANDVCWGMTPAKYMHEKSALFAKAVVPHPRNALRHSFCSYHIAAFKDPGKTATILCHRDQGLLWRHYRGNATEAEGKAYFQILPE